MWKDIAMVSTAFVGGGLIGFTCVVLFGVWGIFISIPIAFIFGLGIGALFSIP